MRVTVAFVALLAACPGPDSETETDDTDPPLCLGDVATGDTDGDGVCDDSDACVGDDATGDTDEDGTCDDQDQCAGVDVDRDDACDDVDNCPGVANPGQPDADTDGQGDACDTCFGDNTSGDTDSDAFCDDRDLCPDVADDQADTDEDGVGDACDTCIGDDTSTDTDHDGLCDDRESDLGTNPNDPDSDDDSVLDGAEDLDGDGIVDPDETDPLDPDTNSDGRCDGPRVDNDNDGLLPADLCRTVLHVDPNAAAGGDGATWATAFRSLPDAMAAATEQTDLWVKAGTYVATAPSTPVIADLPPNVAVRGGFVGTELEPDDRPSPLPRTVFSGDTDGSGDPTTGDAGPIVVASDHLVLDGLEVVDGRGTDAVRGAGVAVGSAAGVALIDVLVADNAVSGVAARGGGVWVGADGEATLTRVTVRGNRADATTDPARGGGLYALDGVVVLDDCLFDDNHVTSPQNAQGGGLYVERGRGTVVGGAFRNNTVTGVFAEGAGLWATGAPLIVDGSEFTANLAIAPSNDGEARGAGVYLEGSSGNPTALIQDAEFSANEAQGRRYAHGGGLYAGTTAPVEILGATFDANVAISSGFDAKGGALYAGGTSVVLRETTFTGNVTDGALGAQHGVLLLGGTIEVADVVYEDNDVLAGVGQALGGFGVGGSRATVDRLTARGNSVSSGTQAWCSGIALLQDVDATDLVVVENTADSPTGGRGALCVHEAGTVDVIGAVVAFNETTGAEGDAAVFARGEIVRLERLVVQANTAHGASLVPRVVGLSGQKYTSRMVLVDSIVAGNHATSDGTVGDAAAFDAGVDWEVWSSTFVGGTVARGASAATPAPALSSTHLTMLANSVVWTDGGPVTVGTQVQGMVLSRVCGPAPVSSDAGLTLTSSPFSIDDDDGDGVAAYYLRHAGLDGVATSTPCVDAGDNAATRLPTRPWGTASTRSDGGLDVGAIDLGAHWPLPMP